jgi:hypothetical protein
MADTREGARGAGGRRQEAGGRRQEAGGRKQKAGGRKQTQRQVGQGGKAASVCVVAKRALENRAAFSGM